MKRLLPLLAAVAVSAGAMTAVAAPAQAAVGTCSVAMPSTLVVTAPYSPFMIELQNDCYSTNGGLAFAAWWVVDARTDEAVDLLVWEFEDGGGSAAAWLEWYDDEQGFGTFYIEPAGAYNSADEEIPQNSPTVVVKAASKGSHIAARSGNTVTVTAGASYYSARYHRQIPWAGAAVQIQSSNAVDGRWTTVATVTTGANGLASKAIYAPSARYWRVLTPTTPSVFGRYSVPSFK